MSLSVVSFASEHFDQWDSFCRISINGTFLHTRKFLSYHEGRFEDFSVLLYEDKRLLAILPAARSLHESDLVVSHPGITYGGFVHRGKLIGERAIEAFRAVSSYYLDCGFSRFLYKPIPYIYSSVPMHDDIYALFRLAARRERCELSTTIDLLSPGPISERRRRCLKKARSVVTLSTDPMHTEALWGVVEDNLARKYGVRPVHSLAEIQKLLLMFPKEILICVALEGNHVVAGVVLFLTQRVWHAQYIASSRNGYDNNALDAVFDRLIRDAHGFGARYFDFGTSNEHAGRTLNSGLYQFKSEFGGGGLSLDFYELDLFKATQEECQLN